MGEVFGTSPLVLLDVDDHDWLILMATARVLKNDADERERQRRREQGDIGTL